MSTNFSNRLKQAVRMVLIAFKLSVQLQGTVLETHKKYHVSVTLSGRCVHVIEHVRKMYFSNTAVVK